MGTPPFDINDIVARINDRTNVSDPSPGTIHQVNKCHEDFTKLGTSIKTIINSNVTRITQRIIQRVFAIIIDCLVARIRLFVHPDYSHTQSGIHGHIVPIEELLGLITIITNHPEDIFSGIVSIHYLSKTDPDTNKLIPERDLKEHAQRNKYNFDQDYISQFVVRTKNQQTYKSKQEYNNNIRRTVKPYLNNVEAYANDVYDKYHKGKENQNVTVTKAGIDKTVPNFPVLEANDILPLLTKNIQDYYDSKGTKPSPSSSSSQNNTILESENVIQPKEEKVAISNQYDEDLYNFKLNKTKEIVRENPTVTIMELVNRLNNLHGIDDVDISEARRLLSDARSDENVDENEELQKNPDTTVTVETLPANTESWEDLADKRNNNLVSSTLAVQPNYQAPTPMDEPNYQAPTPMDEPNYQAPTPMGNYPYPTPTPMGNYPYPTPTPMGQPNYQTTTTNGQNPYQTSNYMGNYGPYQTSNYMGNYGPYQTSNYMGNYGPYQTTTTNGQYPYPNLNYTGNYTPYQTPIPMGQPNYQNLNYMGNYTPYQTPIPTGQTNYQNLNPMDQASNSNVNTTQPLISADLSKYMEIMKKLSDQGVSRRDAIPTLKTELANNGITYEAQKGIPAFINYYGKGGRKTKKRKTIKSKTKKTNKKSRVNHKTLRKRKVRRNVH
jgi:hypothetical protein